MNDPFDLPDPNFTPRVQQVLRLARLESDRLGHPEVGAEHLLLGILRFGDGVAFQVLSRMVDSLDRLKSAAEERIGGEPPVPSANKPFSASARKALTVAWKEANALNHHYVGTEHVLLGMLQDSSEGFAQTLQGLGITYDQVRLEILKELDPNRTGCAHAPTNSKTVRDHTELEILKSVPPTPDPETAGWWLRLKRTIERMMAPPDSQLRTFSPEAQQVLAMARKEADYLRHNYVGTEHLLLAIVRHGRCGATSILNRLNIPPDSVAQRVVTFVGSGVEESDRSFIPYSPRVKKVLALAAKEARRGNHIYCGTEHYLLALLLEGEGVGALVLKEMGVTEKRIRQEMEKLAILPVAPEMWKETHGGGI